MSPNTRRLPIKTPPVPWEGAGEGSVRPHPDARRGRGAASNAVGRYEPETREIVDDGWDNMDTTDVSRNPGLCAVDGTTVCWSDGDCPSGSCNGEDIGPEPPVAPFGPAGAITCP